MQDLNKEELGKNLFYILLFALFFVPFLNLFLLLIVLVGFKRNGISKKNLFLSILAYFLYYSILFGFVFFADGLTYGVPK